MTQPTTSFRMHLALGSCQELLLQSIAAFEAEPTAPAFDAFRADKERLMALLEAMEETLGRTLDAARPRQGAWDDDEVVVAESEATDQAEQADAPTEELALPALNELPVIEVSPPADWPVVPT